LGYPGGKARHDAFFGSGTGVVLLSNVQCRGDEPNIFSCRHDNFGANNCGHRDDAGVVCTARGMQCFYIEVEKFWAKKYMYIIA